MPYERSRTIEERFQKALILIKNTRMNARSLAFELNVSRPTAHRIITELKRRGYSIRSVHEEDGWAYEIANNSRLSNSEPRPHPKQRRLSMKTSQPHSHNNQLKESHNGSVPG